MYDRIIFKIVGYNFAIILFLLALKTILFFLIKSKKKTFKNYLFFSESNLYGTKDPNKKKQKNFQNILSVIILVLLLVQIFLVLITAMFRRKIEP